jgi:ATPase subunit of ABC transporter with duplicated ATPase domains
VAAVSDQLQRARTAQRGATANKRTSKRMKSPKDSDARGILAQTKAEWAEATHGRSVELHRRELQRAEHDLARQRVHEPLGNPVFAGYTPAPSSTIGFIEEGPLTAGDHTLLQLPALTLRRDDRVWIRGPNGAGKSTLIELLCAKLRLPEAELLSLPQELPEPAVDAAQRALRSLDPQARGRVLTIVAGLGVDPDRLLVSQRPSPGEARKLVLALGFARHARALVLDEPENHLDVPSIERIESALSEYPGALYLVTHDELLARRCTRQAWQLERAELTVANTTEVL